MGASSRFGVINWEYDLEDLIMGSVVDLFPDKHIEHNISKLDFWKGRNLIISRDFHTFSVHQKQETLDTVLKINNELYQIILELKGEI